MRAVLVAAACAFPGALAAQQPDPILAKLSAETTNVLVVRDPLPLLEQVLDAAVVQQLLAGTAHLQQASFGRVFTAAALKQQLGAVRALVPAEIVIAAPTRTLDRLSHAAPLFTCWTVLQMLDRAGEAKGEDAASVRATAAQCLAQLDNMPLQAWVKVRDERTAEQWFDAIAEAARANAGAAGLAVKVEGERIELRGEPFAASSPLRKQLESAGIDTSVAPVWEVVTVIEQKGADLELRVGKLAPAPCAAARLGPWAGATDALLFARTEVSDAVVYLTDAYRHVSALAEVDLAEGDAKLMLRLVDFLGRVDALTEDQTAVLRADRGLVWTHEIHGSPGAMADDGVPAPLLRLASADEGPLFVTSDTLDVALSDAIDELLAPDAEPYSFNTLMRTAWEPVLAFLDGDESAVFAPGVLALVRPAQLRGMKDWQHGPMPFVAGAIVARPKSPADAETFMAELSRSIAEANGIDGALWIEQDLGLGTKTHVLRLDAVAPELQQLEIDWDFAPHWFVSGELLVVSTDPKLSKDLLARASVDGAAAAPEKRLQERSVLRGQTLVACVAAMQLWAPMIDELQQWPQDDRVRAFEALQAAGAAIDFVEVRAEVDGNVLRHTLTLRLRDPK